MQQQPDLIRRRHHGYGKNEIKSGKAYSMEEMKMLEQKLQDAMDQLDKVEGKN
jgi:hypothetical protein